MELSLTRMRPGSLWRRLNLWLRLAIAVTLVFVALFALFSVLALRAVGESTDRIQNERLVIARMAAREFDRLLGRTTRQLTASMRFGPGGRLLTDKHILAHVRLALGQTVLGVYVLDGAGTIVRADPPGHAPPRVLERGDLVQHVLATARPAISEPFRHLSGRPAVAIAVPDGRRTPVHLVLVGLIDMTARQVVGPLEQATRLGKTGHGELVGPRGLVIAATDPDDLLKPGEHAPFYRRMLRSRAEGVETVPYAPWDPVPEERRGERHVMAFAPLAAAPWGVAVGGNETETLAPAADLRRTLLLVGSAALAGLWLLTLFGARLLVRPVRRLTRAARDMAGGNLGDPVLVSAGGEIGTLAESLEAMRLQLRGSLETIQRWGTDLEAKVEARTAELRARNRQLAAVTAVATAANRTHDLDGMLRSCLDAILEYSGMDGAAVRLVDPETGRLAEPVARGTFSSFDCERGTVGADECPCGVVLTTKRSVHLLPGSPGNGARCIATTRPLSVVPLRTAAGLQGVLALTRPESELPGREERRMLATIADQLAIAVANARLAQEIAGMETQREAQRIRAELISSVSHELRTPLGFIKSYATTLLRDDAVPEETRRHFLEIIDEETSRLEQMIAELLDASRLQARRLPVQLQPIDLGSMIANAAEKMRPTLAEGGHELVVKVPAEETLVAGDPARLEQVLDNLLTNASRYSDGGTPIEVNVWADELLAVVEVRDHGDGLADDDYERIFEPFFRGASSRAPRTAGVGLGLAICRGILDAHDGRIWAEGAAGGGSSFFVSLPLVPAPAAVPS